MKVQIGSKIRIKKRNDNENYNPFRNKIWVVEAIYHNDTEGKHYDMGLFPQLLVECKDLPVALYEYEFDVVLY